MRHKKDAEQYLCMYPELNKWMNVCPVCHSKGYKPDMPEHISREGSASAQNLRMYFQPLAVNSDGICEQCARYWNK